MKRFVSIAWLAAVPAAAQAPKVPPAPPPLLDGGTVVETLPGTDAGIQIVLPDGGISTDAGISPPRLAPTAELARNDVHAATIHLRVARLYAEGLYDLAGNSSEWNRERGLTLFTGAQNAVSDADRALAELSGLAKAQRVQAVEPIRNARATLSRVTSQLRQLAVPKLGAKGQGIAAQAKLVEIHKALDSALNDVASAAKAMGVETKLLTPP